MGGSYPLCIEAVGVFYHPNRLGHRTPVCRGITPLQRSSRRILQLQPTGPRGTRLWWGSLTPLQRSSRRIIQIQPTGPYDPFFFWVGGLTPLQRSSRRILQIQPTGPHDTFFGWGLTPLQRSSRRILQIQPTGPHDTFFWGGSYPFAERQSVYSTAPEPTGQLLRDRSSIIKVVTIITKRNGEVICIHIRVCPYCIDFIKRVTHKRMKILTLTLNLHLQLTYTFVL